MRLSGTSALVTGAASGLGAATAAALARAGATVYGLDLGPAIAAGPAAPVGVHLLTANVASELEVQGALDLIRNDGAKLRLVANCAGIAPSRRILSRQGPHDLALFEKVVQVNLIGTFNVLRSAASAMQAVDPDTSGQRGLIVNTASIAAFEGQIGQIAYSASKAGIVGMTITAARDLAQAGIRVMTIAPGLVDTPMVAGFSADVQAALAASVTFPQRLAQPAEFAKLVLMIAEHDYLNGEVVRMDGALRMASR